MPQAFISAGDDMIADSVEKRIVRQISSSAAVEPSLSVYVATH